MQSPFERLFLEEYPRVVNVAYRVLADRVEAEDVAQDVFLDFHRRYPDGQDRARSWLHAAAVHTALNTIRGRKRRLRRELTHSRDRTLVSSDDSADPQLALEESERRRLLRWAMTRLPARSASVLALRYGGLSYAEIAQAMGVGTGQVGTLLRRAETALRKEVLKWHI